jgi:hypothetical protein
MKKQHTAILTTMTKETIIFFCAELEFPATTTMNDDDDDERVQPHCQSFALLTFVSV